MEVLETYIDGLVSRTTVGFEKRSRATESERVPGQNKSGVNTTKRESEKQSAAQEVLKTKQERMK